jgi:HD-GYP domain-containing protein (c-di-GMP phosphodiesterase class II)
MKQTFSPLFYQRCEDGSRNFEPSPSALFRRCLAGHIIIVTRKTESPASRQIGMSTSSVIATLLGGSLAGNEERARQLHVLRVILFSALALTLLMAAAVFVFIPTSSDSWIIVAAILIWELIVIFCMQRGRVRVASLLLTSGLCINALATSYLFGGVRQVTFSTYVIVILTGGILLGKRAAFILAGIGIAGGLAMLAAELTGSLPVSDPLDSPTTWAAASVTFVWAAVVLYMALKSIEEELGRRAEEVRKRREAQEQITQLHHETEENLHHVEALHTIDQAITTSQQLPAVLDVLLEQVVNQLHVDAAALSLLNGDGQSLQVAARTGFRSLEMRAVGRRFQDSLAQGVVKEPRLIQVMDLGESDSELRTEARRCGEELTTYWAAPLVAKGQVRGVLEAFNRSRLEERDHGRDFFQTLATQAAIAVENAGLIQDLQQSNDELTLSYDATIEGWSRALELRDGETEGHSRRVTEVTLMLGRRLGLSESELAHVRRGALLHDIGKMAIPDRILMKPSALDEAEWQVMRAHPVYAMQLISPIPFLRPALDIPYCHHEKWDGSGYPRGLKGIEIPLSARMFAIVDVWDALSSDRPYRRAWEREYVHEYLSAQGGSHFDPEILKTFLALIEDLHM